MGQEASKGGARGTGKCYACQSQVTITSKKGVCYKCRKTVCKQCSSKVIPPGGSIKVPVCEQCSGAAPQISISGPKRAEKVISLKPGDNNLPTDWKTLLDMPL